MQKSDMSGKQQSQQRKTLKKPCKPAFNPRKKQFLMSAKNPSKEQEDKINLYFIGWDKAGRHYINNAKFAFKPENLRVHIFHPKNTPSSELPRPSSWLIGHESLTESKDAVWIDLTAYIVSFYSKISAQNKGSSKTDDGPKFKMNLVCGDDEKGKELIAVLKANKAVINIIDGKKNVLFDNFKHVCRSCELIFRDKDQAENHDRHEHNFLCHNIQCERSKRGNGFFTREELEMHLRAQKFCKFCPSDVFCTEAMHKQHVKDQHKQCPCTCREYYEREDDLFEQYYSKYPLPCLEEPACQARFTDIEAQAFHHKSAHGAKYPYFCMACFKIEKLACLATAEELLKHSREMKHVSSDFQFAIIPEKVIQGT